MDRKAKDKQKGNGGNQQIRIKENKAEKHKLSQNIPAATSSRRMDLKMKKSSIPARDTRPIFIKLIAHSGNHSSHSLRIPSKFVKARMPKEAVLKGPSGDTWKVKIREDNEGNMVMMQGWNRFYQQHCLGDYELLLFKHNGNMSFDVQIFDKSGITRKKDVPMTWKDKGPVVEIKEEEEEEEEETENIKDMNPGSSSTPAADDFGSEFPHFKRCLTRSSVEPPFLLRIPTSFIKAANLPQTIAEFTFSTSKQEECWKVKFLSTGNNKVFSQGWKAFAKDNKLKTGDTCVFELLAPRKMRVHIFPI